MKKKWWHGDIGLKKGRIAFLGQAKGNGQKAKERQSQLNANKS